MAINKVKYGNTTLIDLTGTTATADKILTGYGAYGRDGNWMAGTAHQGGGMESVTQDQDGYVVLDDDEGNQIIVDSLSVTTNGTYTAATGHAYSPVSVNVTPNLIAKTVTPSAETQIITPTSITETLVGNSYATRQTPTVYSASSGDEKQLLGRATGYPSSVPATYRFEIKFNTWIRQSGEVVGGPSKTVTGTCTINSLSDTPLTSFNPDWRLLSSIEIRKTSGYNTFDVYGIINAPSGYYSVNVDTYKAYLIEETQYDGLSQVTVNGDADLVAANIKKDVEIFGVTGTYEGGQTFLNKCTVTLVNDTMEEFWVLGLDTTTMIATDYRIQPNETYSFFDVYLFQEQAPPQPGFYALSFFYGGGLSPARYDPSEITLNNLTIATEISPDWVAWTVRVTDPTMPSSLTCPVSQMWEPMV